MAVFSTLRLSRRALGAVLVLVLGVGTAYADRKTVCTITVNSSDEKTTFSRNLPADKYQFVELVEHGRPDWLASACSRGVRCDVLVISGHYDGGNEFFADDLARNEFLPVDELERASCSGACSGLFAQLKEVYLFGCNTLNSEAANRVSSDIGRTLLRAGHSRSDVERLTRALAVRHGESSRDRMRLIFNDVPLIYGFSSVAPLGPEAASLLQRHFRTAGADEVGSGRASSRLLGQFAGRSMVVATGLKAGEPQAGHRNDVCTFADDRLTTAQKLDFVHQVLRRDAPEARMFLERIERQTTALSDSDRSDAGVAAALEGLAADRFARERYLDDARDAEPAAVRVRMLAVARDLGWLTAAEHQSELLQMIGEHAAKDAIGAAETDLVCALDRERGLDRDAALLELIATPGDSVGKAAVLACMGDPESRQRMLRALTSTDERDAQIARVYLRHHPIADVAELRELTAGIARMNGSPAQARALDALAGLRLSDPATLDALARLFEAARSPSVQTAIAGVFIRSDYDAVDRPELVQTLRDHRLKSPDAPGLIDVLIRRLQAN